MSADPSSPAFAARPADAPVYHGFRVISERNGWALGAISEFGAGVTYGDAFVIAPDGARAGLVWEVSIEPHLDEILGFEAGRWGVWSISFPREVADVEDAKAVLDNLVPRLRPKWEAWRARTWPT